MIPDKMLVRRRFEQAATTYEQEAAVQVLVAEKLLQLLDGVTGFAAAPESLLEIGCCTGLLTERVLARFPAVSRVTVADLVPSFEGHVRRKLEGSPAAFAFLAGDIESLPLPEGYDLILSSSTLHWICDLPALFRKLRGHLRSGGLLAFSLYGVKNLSEIREITGVSLQYKGLDELRDMLAAQYEVLVAEQSLETLWFPDPVSVLRHLRATGVNSLVRQAWTKRRLADYSATYRKRFSGERGVSLTYHPLFFIARPRP